MADNWIDDRCTYRHMFMVGQSRIYDILAFHSECQPPCPRKKAAAKYAATFATIRRVG